MSHLAMGKAPSTSDCLATESEARSAVYPLVKPRKFPHTLYTSGGFFWRWQNRCYRKQISLGRKFEEIFRDFGDRPYNFEKSE
ncbi:hypothetical protein AWQ24_15245 (plasmid) [Picosynechococcus sp. PCC 8807]|nr:hypothetical protein AWQ23_14935 [Picosynechococcus sp. PCC 73109]ANV92130.1 hypothetical protein AWQ24_15245 [Picosynechococcus sp. PCC 8807]